MSRALQRFPVTGKLLSTLALLLSVLLCPVPAQALGLEVRPADREVLSEEPRQIVTVAFRVRNGTGRDGQFEAQPVLPAGWRLITPEYPFDLADGETQVRFVSFFIPENTRAGDYTFTYSVRNRQQPAITDAYSLPVRVLSRLKFDVTTLDIPDYVIAGEPYSVSFLVRNRGNVAVNLSYSIDSSLGHRLDPESGTLTLEPSASMPVQVWVESTGVSKPTLDLLSFTASTIDKTTLAEVTGSVRLLPRVMGTEQRFNSIPSRFSLRGAMEERGGTRRSGWQTEITGSGALDEAGERRIDYLLRGPDLRNESVLGTLNEYRVEYRDPHLDLSLGDQVYSLSPLSESGRYGRGAEIHYRTDRWQLASYSMEDRFTANPDEQDAFRAGYAFEPGNRLDLHYLDKKGKNTGDIWTLRSQKSWRPDRTTDLEIARSGAGSERGWAYRGRVDDSARPFRYHLTLLHAEPEYLGYYRDQEFAFFGFDYPLDDSWSLNGTYRFQRDNLDVDPERAAPAERQGILGVDYRWSPQTRVGIDYHRREKHDRRPEPTFDAENDALGVTINRRLGKLNLVGVARRGETKDNLNRERFDTALYLATAHWQATPRQTYNAYLLYDDNAHTLERQSVQKTLGFGAHYRLSAASTLNLNIQGDLDAEHSPYTLNALFEHRWSNGHQTSLAARHSTGDEDRTALMMTYTVPFGLPVSRKRNVEPLRGRVLDAETGTGLKDVVLNLGGLIAVSDSEGRFSFPSVKTGSHHLSLDRPGDSFDKVPVERLPKAIEIRQGDDNRTEVLLVRGATLSGQIWVYELPNSVLPSQTFIKVATGERPEDNPDHRQRSLKRARGLADRLVTFSNGEQTIKRLTDRDGRFRIAGVPPGRWTVTMDETNLPVNMIPEERQLILTLAPGEEAHIEFKVIPAIRTIKMLDPLPQKI